LAVNPALLRRSSSVTTQLVQHGHDAGSAASGDAGGIEGMDWVRVLPGRGNRLQPWPWAGGPGHSMVSASGGRLLRHRFLQWFLVSKLCRDTAGMLLTWIAEVADEPLVLEPTDRRVEWETNTWWLGAEDEDWGALSVSEVVAAFERTAEGVRLRIREMGFVGVATFYVWHDEQAGQLRCSTGSVGADQLPFSGAYVPSADLGLVVEGFLSDREPGVVACGDPEDVNDQSAAAPEPEVAPFPVWVRSVGTVSC